MDYSHFLNTATSEKWKKIGLKRRAGAVVPLFSVYSKNSIGIGEIPDLKNIVKWCKKTGLSIIQLLPMNDVSFDFAPYNSVSSFALEPMYLSLNNLKSVNLNLFKKEIRDLKRKFSSKNHRVDYSIKNEKLKILKKIYNNTYLYGNKKYDSFKSKNIFWLRDYAIFKTLKEINNNKSWEEWEDKYKFRNEIALQEFEKQNEKNINFYYWVQWQLFEQFSLIKKYSGDNNVLIMGDLPFLVSRDSADVWTYQKYFKLNYSSGAPPDMYFANGQKWGMPPYNRGELQNDNYTYITSKLKYAENFYDLYRIDHFVGFFRLWTIDGNTPEERGGLDGAYDPLDEHLWEENGKQLLNAMLESSKMLPCAEDLGTVPECSPKVLWDYGIPGINVQRWTKDFNNDFNLLKPEYYRLNSVSTISTHDSSTIIDWWHNEAGTIDEKLFERLCFEKNIKDEKYFEVVQNLFDSGKSNHGRLFWKSEIYDNDILVKILGLNYEQCWDIIHLYRESYKEKSKFLNFIGIEAEENNYKIDSNFIKSVIKKSTEAASIFSIQLLQEWLFLNDSILTKAEETSYRINFPGVVNDTNWTFVLPVSLEYILNMEENEKIKEIIINSNRI